MIHPKYRSFLTKILLLLCGLAVIALLLFFILVQREKNLSASFKDITISLIPNLIASLISICTVILLFYLSKISPDEILGADTMEMEDISLRMQKAEEKLDKIHDLLAKGEEELHVIATNQKRAVNTHLEVSAPIIYGNHRQVEWHRLLSEAKTIDIVVVYYDTWVKSNWETLVNFFRTGGQLRIVLPNPENPDNLRDMLKYFPKMESNTEELRNRIIHTMTFLREVYNAAAKLHGRHGMYEIYCLDNSINYPFVLVDNKTVISSFFEHFSDMRVNSPSFLVNYADNLWLKEYWEKEINLLLKSAIKQP
ncbi:MAG: hypothetical protein JST83_11875 [Bacteroidetes bacterium]|nr:hypothetical protein [Bacteroidota bacterium]